MPASEFVLPGTGSAMFALFPAGSVIVAPLSFSASVPLTSRADLNKELVSSPEMIEYLNRSAEVPDPLT